jgi:AcrR family transcriptional regulator
MSDQASHRERILDAATIVMRNSGLAHATTKLIAQQAGFSEAMLYRSFSDKQEIYIAVLKERLGGLDDPDDLVGRRDVDENLVDLTRQLMQFYVRTFPLSASIFGSPALVVAWREGMTEKGRGPRSLVKVVERYLDGEIEIGRIDRDTDAFAVAALLCGSAFQHAFFACFDGLAGVPDEQKLAERLVTAALRAA